MKREDLQYVLNDLLFRWHVWSRHTAYKAGFAGKAAGFGQSRSNSQYDWESGVESALVDKRVMEGFDAAAQRIPQPWFTALQFEARNLSTGYAVWTSPRLPTNREEREVLVLEARVRLLKELARDGVLC